MLPHPTGLASALVGLVMFACCAQLASRATPHDVPPVLAPASSQSLAEACALVKEVIERYDPAADISWHQPFDGQELVDALARLVSERVAAGESLSDAVAQVCGHLHETMVVEVVRGQLQVTYIGVPPSRTGHRCWRARLELP